MSTERTFYAVMPEKLNFYSPSERVPLCQRFKIRSYEKVDLFVAHDGACLVGSL